MPRGRPEGKGGRGKGPYQRGVEVESTLEVVKCKEGRRSEYHAALVSVESHYQSLSLMAGRGCCTEAVAAGADGRRFAWA